MDPIAVPLALRLTERRASTIHDRDEVEMLLVMMCGDVIDRGEVE